MSTHHLRDLEKAKQLMTKEENQLARLAFFVNQISFLFRKSTEQPLPDEMAALGKKYGLKK